MAAPTDTARPTTQLTSAGTSTNINVGSPTAGDLLVVFIRWMATVSAVTFTGYTALASLDGTDASDDVTSVYYRWADGAEGASDAISWTTSAKLAAICWVVEGAQNPTVQAPNISTVANFTTAANSANATSVSVTGGPKDVLYITAMGKDGEGGVATAFPANYANLVTIDTGVAGVATINGDVAGATRQVLQTSSEDAGTWTHPAANAGGNAYTIAVQSAISLRLPNQNQRIVRKVRSY